MKVSLGVLLFACVLGQFLSCAAPSYNHYVRGKALMLEKNYEAALAEFELGLKGEPDGIVLTYEKARCLYRLERWTEAKAAFERFLQLTDTRKSTYADERWDAEFCIKKCKQMLGEEEKPQRDADSGDSAENNGNEDTIGGIHIVSR